MKGTLHKTENGWQVWYHAKQDLYYGNTGVRILPILDHGYVNGPGLSDSDEGKEVEFEIFDNREICNCACHRNADITHFVACCNDGYKTDNLGHVNYYAKLVHNWLTMKEGDITVNFKPMPEFDEPAYPTRLVQLKEQAWDVIYQEFIKNTDGISSLALLEYLKDNYNPPTKKQDNDNT
jgi:hypothetical protein